MFPISLHMYRGGSGYLLGKVYLSTRKFKSHFRSSLSLSRLFQNSNNGSDSFGHQLVHVVVVTGGGSGIGAAIVGAFAAAGSTKIAIISRNKSNLDDTKARVELDHPGVSVLPVVADVTKELEVGRAFADVEQSFGKIDVFVNNSGFTSEMVALGDSESGDWWRAHEVNVLGSFLAFKGFHAHASPKAFVLNVTSVIAHMPAIPAGVSAYASSKAASAKLFDYIAGEYPQYHVVNIQPGIVASDLNRKTKIAALDHGMFI